MRVLFVDQGVFIGSIRLPTGCLCLIVDPDELIISQRLVERLLQMELPDNQRSYLERVHDQVRVTHDKWEEH